MNLLFLGLAALFLSCSAENRSDMQSEIPFPFQPGAEKCLERLSGVEILDDGARQLIEAARAGSAFTIRFREIQGARRRIVESYRALPEERQDMLRENDFACVADDLLEAMFASEVERIRRESSGSERASELDQLESLLEGLDLNPAWNDYAKARLMERIGKARPE
jgi:hypothetical protein